LATFLVVVLGACNFRLIRAAETAQYLPPESGMRQHPVALEKFVQLHTGMKLADVERLLAKRGEHHFTYRDDEATVWKYFQYAVAHEPRYASSAYNLLYKDSRLYAVIDYMDDWDHLKALAHLLDQENNPVKRTEQYIQELFHVKALRGNDIAASMGKLKKRVLDEEQASKAREKRNPPDPGLTVLISVFNLLTPAEQAEFKRAYKSNVEYMAKFDGGTIDIGMTEAQVEKIFGKPLASDNLSNAEHVAIYGPSDTKVIGAVQPYLACGPVAVLFHDGAAARVMSNWYCDVEWRDKAWPELKPPQRGSKK
jgi:hypothetical protein